MPRPLFQSLSQFYSRCCSLVYCFCGQHHKKTEQKKRGEKRGERILKRVRVLQRRHRSPPMRAHTPLQYVCYVSGCDPKRATLMSPLRPVASLRSCTLLDEPVRHLRLTHRLQREHRLPEIWNQCTLMRASSHLSPRPNVKTRAPSYHFVKSGERHSAQQLRWVSGWESKWTVVGGRGGRSILISRPQRNARGRNGGGVHVRNENDWPRQSKNKKPSTNTHKRHTEVSTNSTLNFHHAPDI